MFTVGLGLLGATLIILAFRNTASAILVGFGFGGSLLALFLRVGGGIFTKAADVGADLVGKVEAGIPEDDPRNPATIADNVGDCAGMAADLFESYEVTLVAAMILGGRGLPAVGLNPALGVAFPVVVRAIGVLASVVGVYLVRATARDRSPLTPINREFLAAGVLTVLSTYLVARFYVHNLASSGPSSSASFSPRWRAASPSTSRPQRPRPYATSPSRREPAPPPRSFRGSARDSSRACGRWWRSRGALGTALALGDGNLQYSLYLVALCGLGMLATTGVVVSEDTFGPVADNAAGIAEMSGEFSGEPARIMVALDAAGNTTKAVTKGFAIGSAVIAAVALFAS